MFLYIVAGRVTGFLDFNLGIKSIRSAVYDEQPRRQNRGSLDRLAFDGEAQHTISVIVDICTPLVIGDRLAAQKHLAIPCLAVSCRRQREQRYPHHHSDDPFAQLHSIHLMLYLCGLRLDLYHIRHNITLYIVLYTGVFVNAFGGFFR